jgi:hypothetical protein
MKKKALHPVVLANVGLLPEIPFLRIADWPFRGTTGNVAGVISAPEAAEIYFSKVESCREELTSF